MWEASIGLLGLILGIGGMMVRNAFASGKNQKIQEELILSNKELKEDMAELKDTVAMMSRNILLQEQRIDQSEDNRKKIDSSIDSLNENISKNNQALASLKATMDGVNTLLQNIFSGNLKIANGS